MLKTITRTIIVTLTAALTFSAAADSGAARAELLTLYGDTVYQAPTVHRVPEMDEGPIQALYYDALDYEGKPTRVFAYLGIPESPEGTPLPGMVLAHGGGGTAFHQWVKVWYDQGYASISMDLEGFLPEPETLRRAARHEYAGPIRTGMFDDEAKPRQDQWMYHAVADIMLAHSLLRSREEVDASRIGLTGISWGGVLSSLTAGVDDRFVFSAPVYGCGFLYDSKGYFNKMGAKDDETLALRKYWDPARFFTNASMPMLWVNGDNDPHFSVDVMSRSHIAAGPESILSIHHRMPHGHGAGWEHKYVPEIYALAEHLLKGTGSPLPKITQQPVQMGNGVTTTYEGETPIKTATLWWRGTPLEYSDEGRRHLDLVEQWQEAPATVHNESGLVAATLPEGCVSYYINLTDERGCIVSTNVMMAD
jgi:dienelactone hydrolase